MTGTAFEDVRADDIHQPCPACGGHELIVAIGQTGRWHRYPNRIAVRVICRRCARIGWFGYGRSVSVATAHAWRWWNAGWDINGARITHPHGPANGSQPTLEGM